MLGPLEVRDGAGSVRAVTGTRLRALLVLLALRAGQVAPAGSLIDELWGRDLPADAANALQALVSRLRRALGEPAAVVSGPAGYRLAIGPDDVDVFRFERLAARGHANRNRNMIGCTEKSISSNGLCFTCTSVRQASEQVCWIAAKGLTRAVTVIVLMPRPPQYRRPAASRLLSCRGR